MRKKNSKLLILLIFICAIILFRITNFGNYLTLDALKTYRASLQDFVSHNYLLAVAIYILSYITVALLALPAAALFTIVGGFLFDVIPAVIYTNIGATLGATGAFLLFRYVFSDWVHKAYNKKLYAFNANIRQYGSYYLIIARLIAIIPFFLVNILAALAPIRLSTFIWTTALGIIPATAVFAYAGTQLMAINSLRDIFSTNLLIAAILLILLGLIAGLAKQLSKK